MSENENVTYRTTSSEKGFFGKLSNGDFGLAKTYWLYGVLIDFVGGIAIQLITSIGLFAIVMLAYTAYRIPVIMGIWRAASKYEGYKIWAVLAKIAAVLGVIMLAVGLISMVELSASAKRVVVAEESAPATQQAGQRTPIDELMETQKMVPPIMLVAPPAMSQESWILQLGAFKNVDSVNALVSKLRAAGYSAHTSPRTPVQGQLNRVFIGPDVSEAKLQGMRGRIAQMTGLSGSVVAYNP
jgi:DedD protein